MRAEAELCDHLRITRDELGEMPAMFVDWVQQFRRLF